HWRIPMECCPASHFFLLQIDYPYGMMIRLIGLIGSRGLRLKRNEVFQTYCCVSPETPRLTGHTPRAAPLRRQSL
ncbi:MAG: hypothetical protein WCU80_08605, partial [Paludibacteraceae bacterium]